ncbi:EF-P 5-aminopentanol modification-associated protein YfmF [Alkalicoccus chagannorensis]|uniref:EF-P 5-aminopentanol modification-associated protein YfmF n=1 Tax=Alkalicoccus chagannorensis TaxID=427072 RepID=UPI001FDFBEF0|nr:pitrilysin family protein [Alkalicoccus chagannorensis]
MDINTIRTHIEQLDTFKTTTLVFQLRTRLERKDLTEKALLPSMLERGTKHFPSRQHVQGALEELYGASLSGDVVKKGEHHVVTIKLEAANEKFLQEEVPLLERAVQMTASLLFYPNIQDGAFPEDILQEEKRSHAQKIQSVYDDKMRFANKRLAEEMCDGEGYALPVLGMKEDLEQITGASLYDAYQRLISEAQMDFYVVGDVDPKETGALIEHYMHPDREHMPGEYQLPAHEKPADVKVVKETQQLKQAKLHIGYRTGISFGDSDYFALQMANSLFGGAPHSKLFVNVREKESLAYYAASRLESHKGLMIVMAGIDTKKFDQADAIIDEQLDAVKQGDFTEADVEQTRAVLMNQIRETMDTARGLVELDYHSKTAGTKLQASDWLDALASVTKEDMIRAASGITKDTVYFLQGEES